MFLGLNSDHLANPMLTKLMEPGAFSIIRDERTRQWRAVRPYHADPTVLDPYDLAYKEQWRDAPPLVPPRVCNLETDIAWNDKKRRVPRLMLTKTGWNVLWRSSEGDPEQGTQRNLGWIDEQIQNEQFFFEFQRGSMRTGGIGIWSATPQKVNRLLFDLAELARTGSENYHLTVLSLEDSPFMPPKEKAAFRESLPDDEYRVRFLGEFAVASKWVYNRFDAQGLHGCDPFTIPEEWTIYAILDPGRQFNATLLVAIDPDDKHLWVYDGWVLKQQDAIAWSYQMKERLAGRQLESVVCDLNMGRQHTAGMVGDDTVATVYANALKKADVVLRRYGPLGGGFFPGCNDVPFREEKMLAAMTPRVDGPHTGTPRLKIFRGSIPQLEEQIRRAETVVKDGKERRKKQEDDLLDCLEYAVAADLTWQPPAPKPVAAMKKHKKLFEMVQNRDNDDAPSYNFGG